jgi:GDP-L-fucose synthase
MNNKNLLKQKIFIAGHNGMVGSSLHRYFLKHEIKNIITVSKKKLNLLNSKELEKFIKIKKPDIIINCAGRVGGILANSSYPVEFLNENILIQLNLINISYKSKIKHFINLGSSCIYPRDFKRYIKETDLLSSSLEKTNEAYALAKIIGLKACEYYNKQYNTNYITLMPCNLYGPQDNFDKKNSHFIPALIQKFVESKFLKKNFVEIWGSGKPKREIMHVDDLSGAIYFILNKKISNNKSLLKLIKKTSVINVGSGKDFSIKKYAQIINNLTSANKNLKFNKKYPDGTMRKILDSSLIKSLGWKPSIDVTRGLSETIDWYKKNY